MKRNLVVLAIAAFGLTTFGVSAKPQEEKTSRTEQTCCEAKKECREDKKNKDKKKCDRKADCKVKGDKRAKKMSPFDGIDLTEQQQKQIDALKAERKASREKAKADGKEAMKKDKEAFDAKIASILTPEQMVQYKANCDSIKARKIKKGDLKGKKGHDKKGHDKKGHDKRDKKDKKD